MIENSKVISTVEQVLDALDTTHYNLAEACTYGAEYRKYQTFMQRLIHTLIGVPLTKAEVATLVEHYKIAYMSDDELFSTYYVYPKANPEDQDVF